MIHLRRLAARLDQGCTAALVAWVMVPPLLVRLFILPVSSEAAPVIVGPWHGDTSSFAKSAAVVACAVWMLAHLCLRAIADPGWRPALRRPLLLALPALTVTAVSALASPYPLTAWLGFPGLHEGGAVWLAYGVAFVYAAAMPDQTRLLSWLRLLLPLVGVQILLGMTQAGGLDFWQSTPGRWLAGTADTDTVFVFSQARVAYGSLYQPNQYGMAMALFGALAFAMAYVDSHHIWRFLWAAAIPPCLFCVWSSHSRAGLLAFFAAVAAWAAFRVKIPVIRVSPRVAVVILLAAAGTAVASRPGRLLVDKTLCDLLPPQTAVPARVELEANRFTLPPDPAALTAYPNGWSRIDTGGASLFFFTVGDDVWHIDIHGRPHSRLKPAPDLGLTRFENLASSRGYIWSRALAALRGRFWLGAGPGVFPLIFPHEDAIARLRHFPGGEIIDKPHGIWLQILTGSGFLGLIAMLAAVGFVLRRGFGSGSPLARACCAAVIAYLVAGATTDSTPGVTPLAVFLLGMGFNASDRAGRAYHISVSAPG